MSSTDMKHKSMDHFEDNITANSPETISPSINKLNCAIFFSPTLQNAQDSVKEKYFYDSIKN